MMRKIDFMVQILSLLARTAVKKISRSKQCNKASGANPQTERRESCGCKMADF